MSRIADNIRKYISCHQFGDEHYGEWGILTFKQRELIKELTETCNMFERTADEFGKANMKFKHQLALTEKALELACDYIDCDDCPLSAKNCDSWVGEIDGCAKAISKCCLEKAKEMMKSE